MHGDSCTGSNGLMHTVLVVIVMLTKSTGIVIVPHNLERCPTKAETYEHIEQSYNTDDVTLWTYQCFDPPRAI